MSLEERTKISLASASGGDSASLRRGNLRKCTYGSLDQSDILYSAPKVGKVMAGSVSWQDIRAQRSLPSVPSVTVSNPLLTYILIIAT